MKNTISDQKTNNVNSSKSKMINFKNTKLKNTGLSSNCFNTYLCSKKRLNEQLFLNFSSMTNIKETSLQLSSEKLNNHLNLKENKTFDDVYFNDDSLHISSTNEDLFIFKLHYMISEIFDYFYEDVTPNLQQSLNKSSISIRAHTLSDTIREIFYSRNTLLSDDNFIFKGTYQCDINTFLRKKKLKDPKIY